MKVAYSMQFQVMEAQTYCAHRRINLSHFREWNSMYPKHLSFSSMAVSLELDTSGYQGSTVYLTSIRDKYLK
jgi:hypothetical protein